MRGKAMSGAPIISGTIQLPNPPMVAGMTMKNTMIRPCAVTNTLKTSGIAEDLHARLHQLGAHAHRQHAADHAADHGEDEIHRADVFVIGREHPAPPSGRMIVVMGWLRHGRFVLPCLSSLSSCPSCVWSRATACRRSGQRLRYFSAVATLPALVARGARLVLGEPIGELLFGHDADRDRHEGVIAAAELRALAVEHAGRARP